MQQGGNFNAMGQPPKKGSSTCLVVGLILGGLGILLVSVVGTLAISGVRRYLAAAKTAEAKNTVGAISRAAVSAYERERGLQGSERKLCGSSIAVPATVPAGKKYAPVSGADFDTGDDENGWRCLRFSMTMPIYYQYRYVRGGGYLSPQAQGMGPNSFEAQAMGDLDADGTTSQFAVAGQVEPSGTVRVSSQIHIYEEFE